MIDSSKAYVNLNWKNIYTIDNALSETITWYKTYQSKQKDMKEAIYKKFNKLDD